MTTKPAVVAEGIECPTGCGRGVAGFGLLMCGTCWREVPADLQRQVYRTWAELRRAVRNDRSTMKQARASYEVAKAAAIASIA